ncbi:MAG: hypothetical protein NUV93_04780 [Firmicutes bacterium]|nr:hypothetical protein [Bacillota bacterium]
MSRIRVIATPCLEGDNNFHKVFDYLLANQITKRGGVVVNLQGRDCMSESRGLRTSLNEASG